MSTSPSPGLPEPLAPASFTSLKIKSASDVVAEAQQEISLRASGIQFGLRSSFPKADRLLLGGHQFGQCYYYCGMSGSGKSYALNQLQMELTDVGVNGRNHGFGQEVYNLHFCFEMNGSTEIIRATTRLVNMAYRDLISADRPLSPQEQIAVRQAMTPLSGRPIYYVETPGNRMRMLATYDEIRRRHPKAKIIVSVDHTHLPEFLDEKNETELLTKLAHSAQMMKKDGAMVILIGQFNTEIEDAERLQRANLHYPTKKDIHGGKQLYWAVDWCCMWHRPEMLNITLYGPKQIPTKDRMFAHWIKTRNSEPGIIEYKPELSHGLIVELP